MIRAVGVEQRGQVIEVLKNYRRPPTSIWMIAALVFLLLGLSRTSAYAAQEAQSSNGPPAWIGLFGVAIEPTSGAYFAAGAKGMLMTSTDQGKTWKQIPVQLRPGGRLFQDYDLYSIRFSPSGKLGLIVGENGIVLRSTDSGSTWQTEPSGTLNNLMKVFLVDDQNAVAVGINGEIRRTTDGGQTWQGVKSPKEITLFDVTFLDKNTGWIAGEFSTVLGTSDGGKTWNLLSGGNTADFTIGPFFTINFTDAKRGMVAGLAGDIETSEDGGKTWKSTKLSDPAGMFAVALDASNNKAFAIGSGGRTFVRGANGQWAEAPRVTFNDLTDIALAGNHAVMVGLNGTILLSDDAGEKWQAVQ
jgi:photosystem II stability/assembly factor-like uncharacterized protein